MQGLLDHVFAHIADRRQTYPQMLADPFGIKGIGHAGQHDLTMQGLVRNSQQGAVGHPLVAMVADSMSTAMARDRLKKADSSS